MKTEIVVTDNFQKEAKRYLKRYTSLKSELKNLYARLIEDPKLGTSLGNNNYKIRIGVKSKGKGKSGGLRIITHLEIDLVFDSGKLVWIILYEFDGFFLNPK